MKNIFVLLLVASVTISGQNTVSNTLSNASVNSADIHAMVQKQISNALEKQNKANLVLLPALEEKINVLSPNMKTTQAERTTTFTTFLLDQPLHNKLFAAGSFLIVFFVVLRRILSNLNRKSAGELNNKIGMLRNEKIGGSKSRPRLIKIRKALKDKIEVFKQSEKQVSKTARQLNVAKGELMLAARLKLFEADKI